MELRDHKDMACPTVDRPLSEGTQKLTKAVLRAICGLKFMFIDMFSASAPLGPRGRGPSLRTFLLLAASVDAEMNFACLSPCRTVVSSKTTIEEWPCYQRNQTQAVSRRRVLRTPPPLSSERGVLQVTRRAWLAGE